MFRSGGKGREMRFKIRSHRFSLNWQSRWKQEGGVTGLVTRVRKGLLDKWGD